MLPHHLHDPLSFLLWRKDEFYIWETYNDVVVEEVFIGLNVDFFFSNDEEHVGSITIYF